MKSSQGHTALLLAAIVAAVVVPMGNPTPPQGPPPIPKKPNAVVLAEVKPGPQDPPPKPRMSLGSGEAVALEEPPPST